MKTWDVWLKRKKSWLKKLELCRVCFPNIFSCQLYINSKYACRECDSSRHAFKTIMREPMSWKYTVYSLWVLTKCLQRTKTNTSAFWQDTAQQHTSSYRRECHNDSYKRYQNTLQWAHKHCEQRVLGGWGGANTLVMREWQLQVCACFSAVVSCARYSKLPCNIPHRS